MNDEHIEKFCNQLFSEGLSQRRVKKYSSTLRTLSNFLKKDFKKCNKDDLVNLFADIQSDKLGFELNGEKKTYAENTKRDFRIVVKRFWKYLGKEDLVKDWLKTTKNKRLEKIIKTKDVLSEEEVYKMVDIAQHLRDKAIISLLYETGSRIGEISDLNISDVVFDEKGYNFVSRGKTGEVYKRVVNFKAVELLKNWLKNHPLREKSDAPLWITLSRSHTGLKKLGYNGFNHMLKEVAKNCGIAKKVNPHAFRHARITNLRIVRKMPDAIIEMMVGWIPGTNMFDVYQHSTSDDVDKALTENYGLKEEQKKNEMIEKFDSLLATDSNFRMKIAKLLNERGVKI